MIEPGKWDTGIAFARSQMPRRSARMAINAEVQLRRPGQMAYCARVLDLSQHGCRLEFVELPELDELVFIRIAGLEPIPAEVCWTLGHVAGLEFGKTIHPAVFDMEMARLRGDQPDTGPCAKGRP